MSSTQETPSDFSSSSPSFQQAPSEPNGAITLPKASLLFGQGSGGVDDEVENAPDEPDEATDIPTASELYERGLAIVGDAAAAASPQQHDDFALPRLDFAAPTSDQSTNSGSRRGRRWLVAGLAVAVAIAVALTIGATTPIHDTPNRHLALTAIPAAQVLSADQPAAGAEETHATPADWSNRAAQLQFVTPALASSADLSPDSASAADAASVVAVNAASPTPAPLGPTASALPCSWARPRTNISAL